MDPPMITVYRPIEESFVIHLTLQGHERAKLKCQIHFLYGFVNKT